MSAAAIGIATDTGIFAGAGELLAAAAAAIAEVAMAPITLAAAIILTPSSTASNDDVIPPELKQKQMEQRKADDAAKAAEGENTKPCAECAASGGKDPDKKDDDQNSEHAKERMQQRNVSQDRVKEAMDNGTTGPGKTPDTIVREVSSSESASGRGVRVVVNKITGKVITVIDKGSKFISKLPK